MRGAAEAELVEAARRGGSSALGRFARRPQRRVFAVAFSLVGDQSEAEDRTQAAFIRASRSLDLLADPAEFGACMRGCVFVAP